MRFLYLIAVMMVLSGAAQAQDGQHFALDDLQRCKTESRIAAHKAGDDWDENTAEKKCLHKLKGDDASPSQKVYSVCRKLALYEEFLICIGDKKPAAAVKPPTAQKDHYKTTAPPGKN